MRAYLRRWLLELLADDVCTLVQAALDERELARWGKD